GRVRAFCRALSPSYYVSEEAASEAIRRRASFNVVHVDTAVKVDLFLLRETAYDRESFHRRRREEVFPFGPCFVPSPEDVVLRKLLWFESGGRASDRQWSDILGVLATQGPGLDREYLSRWAADLGIAALLAEAEAKSGG
ncbi:MAG TPA: hypothetical protein VFS92_04910, partial [Planctomycetota bacterium]|nr:hypothetical protein [Planctomycetota bacterium]